MKNILIRKFNSNDLDEILDLFYNTIHSINARDYSKKQLDAWGVADPDKDRWLFGLSQNKTYVAKINNIIVGFGDLNSQRYIDRLYIHKDYQNIGIATNILKMLEENAMKLGYGTVYTEASITAKGFFLSKGYSVVVRQNKSRNGEVFINYIMEKKLVCGGEI